MNALSIAGRLALSIPKEFSTDVKNIDEVILYSESQIVLYWVKKSPCKQDLCRLVSNRLREIREIISAINLLGSRVFFGYISSEDNPADAGTRRFSKEQIDDHHWWTGPKFLRQPSGNW